MLIRIAVYVVLFLAASFAQSPTAQPEGPRFEVVAIKPLPRPTPGDGTPSASTSAGVAWISEVTSCSGS